MFARMSRSLKSLELAEQILNAAALVALVSVFFPWLSGEWLRTDTGAASDVSFNTSFSGVSFFTSFLGIAVLFLQLFILLVTLVPLAGGPVLIKKKYREFARLIASVHALILVLATLTVLTKVTLEFPRMEVRFGIYICLIASIVVLFEASMRFVEQKKLLGKELFHHPEDIQAPEQREETLAPPPPPPPPPAPEPEDHRLYP
jgi:hypothetical protein